MDRIVDESALETTFPEYDAHGNPRRIVRQTGSGAVTTTNTYDARSRLRTSESTLGPKVTYTYDALDRIVVERYEDPTGIRDGYE